MGAFDRIKKMSGKAKDEEVKIVKVDIETVSEAVSRDDKWDIATRENQEKIAALEATKQEQAAQEEIEESEEIIPLYEDEDAYEYHMEDRKCVVDGYGIISDLPESIMGNALEIIKVLEKARDREQWLYILDNAKSEAFDITLIDYIFEHGYTIDEYKVNTCVPNSVIKKQTSIFYRFLKETLMNNDNDKLMDLLSVVSFIDERIIEIVVNNKDRNRIIRDNYLLKFDDDKKLFYALLDYEEKREVRDFSFLDSMVLGNLGQGDIERLLDAGYEVTENSPMIILTNNEVIRKIFLKEYDQDVINLLLTKAKNRAGFSWKLANINNKQVLTKYFMKVMGMKDFLSVIKYIEFAGIKINIDKTIETESIELIRSIYRKLNGKRKFDSKLFIDLINLYETNTELMRSIGELDSIDEYLVHIILLLSMKDKTRVNSVDDLDRIEEIIYEGQVSEIENTTDILLLKDYICYDLIGEHYLNVHKLLIELMSSDKLKNLKNSIIDESKRKEVDKYINLSIFLEGLVDCDNISVLKNVASTVSECVYKTKIWNKEIYNLEREIMSLYTYEINEKMTDFNLYMTNKTFNYDGSLIGLVNIKRGMEFNLFTSKLSYYGNDKNLKNVKSSDFSLDIYRSLNGISDEFCNIDIKNGEVVLLYNKIPEDSLLMMASRELGIDFESKDYNIVINTQVDAMPFRKLVRNTRQAINESRNEYIVDKDLVEPNGVLIFGIPTEEQIKVASYLEVPLVNIEELTSNEVTAMNGLVDINYINIKEENYVEEDVTHDNSNDQFLELFGSLLEIKGEPDHFLEVEYDEGEYVVEENGVTRRVIPLFRYCDSLDGKIDVSKVLKDKVKSDIFKELFQDASINYEIKKELVDGEIVLSVVYDFVDDEEFDITDYDITSYLKKLAISYLIGDPYDGDSYNIKQEYSSNSEQLFENIDLVTEYEKEMDEIKSSIKEGTIAIDYMNLIDFMDKIEKMDVGEYLCIFKEFIDVRNNMSSNLLIEALLNKKNSLVTEMGKVIEYFSKDN